MPTSPCKCSEAGRREKRAGALASDSLRGGEKKDRLSITELALSFKPRNKLLLTFVLYGTTREPWRLCGGPYLLNAGNSHTSHGDPHYDDRQHEEDVGALPGLNGAIEIRRHPKLFLHPRHGFPLTYSPLSSRSLLDSNQMNQLPRRHNLPFSLAPW